MVMTRVALVVIKPVGKLFSLSDSMVRTGVGCGKTAITTYRSAEPLRGLENVDTVVAHGLSEVAAHLRRYGTQFQAHPSSAS